MCILFVWWGGDNPKNLRSCFTKITPEWIFLTHPSEPGREGVLSEEIEDTEATERGLEDDGIVNDLTMDLGRLPRLSSRLEGYNKRIIIKNLLKSQCSWYLATKSNAERFNIYFPCGMLYYLIMHCINNKENNLKKINLKESEEIFIFLFISACRILNIFWYSFASMEFTFFFF